jgi:predicted O-methyltransferase YrrM
MTFDEAWAFARDVEGWLTPAQARVLFDAASLVPPGQAIVEIGSHRGKSTILLAAGMSEGVTLTAVDPFDDPRWGGGPESLDAFEKNLDAAGVRDRVTLFRGLSGDAARTWDGPTVGLAWIDGAHDLASVLIDLDGWGPHVAPRGMLLVHDAFSALGTTEAVLRRLWWSRSYRFVGAERTLVQFQKVDRSTKESVRDALELSRRLPFFARMVAIKLARRGGHDRAEQLFMRGDNEPLI